MPRHQGNVIPHCLCNPETLFSKETHSVKKLYTVLFYITETETHNETVMLTLLMKVALKLCVYENYNFVSESPVNMQTCLT